MNHSPVTCYCRTLGVGAFDWQLRWLREAKPSRLWGVACQHTQAAAGQSLHHSRQHNFATEPQRDSSQNTSHMRHLFALRRRAFYKSTRCLVGPRTRARCTTTQGSHLEHPLFPTNQIFFFLQRQSGKRQMETVLNSPKGLPKTVRPHQALGQPWLLYKK